MTSATRDMAELTETPPVYDFALAVRAFDQFTLAEKRQAIEIMAGLRFPAPTDRFFEAVHRVITKMKEPT